MRSDRSRRFLPWGALILLLSLGGCTVDPPAAALPESPGPAPGGEQRHATPPDVAPSDAPPPAVASAVASTAPTAPPGTGAPAGTAPAGEATQSYPWMADESLQVLEAVDSVEDRFPPPPGFARVEVARSSFGAWLRRLPLAAPGTPVLSYAGSTILAPDDPHLGAVVAIDVGKADLQQCADAIIRLHAEWQWSQGRRDISYQAGSGSPMPLSRWTRGERPVGKKQSIAWEPRRSRADKNEHASFRAYLDHVFMWANTGSLSTQAMKITPNELRPGDFVVQPGGPGHSVIVLDLAVARDGRRVALLGQSFMPAQRFHVLRPGGSSAWFTIDPEAPGIKTPFWPTFKWATLRRLDGA